MIQCYKHNDIIIYIMYARINLKKQRICEVILQLKMDYLTGETRDYMQIWKYVDFQPDDKGNPFSKDEPKCS